MLRALQKLGLQPILLGMEVGHITSLPPLNFYLVGSPTGSKPIAALGRSSKMQLCYLPELPKPFRRLPFLILGPIKVIHQLVYILLWLLVWIDLPPDFILVQVSLKLYFMSPRDIV